jgi:holdfast attachment protein HfaB
MRIRDLKSRKARAVAVVAAAGIGLSACGSVTPNGAGLYATPVVRAPVTANPTPYTAALNCLATYARANNLSSPRIAIARIEDKTGKVEADGSGRKITGGASEMAMTAFSKAGANLVERFDTSVSDMEMKLASQKLISDAAQPASGAPGPYRMNFAGQVEGSDFYIVGSITEVNWNILSTGTDLNAASENTRGLKGRIGGRTYVMNVGTDIRVVETISQRVVGTVSLQKQILGTEVGAGLFDFLGGHVYDLSVGRSALEPVQLAVRALIERTAVEMMANFYGMPGPESCMGVDPLGGQYQTAGLTGDLTPAYNNVRTNNGQTRSDPDRWNSAYDRNVHAGRGRY